MPANNPRGIVTPTTRRSALAAGLLAAAALRQERTADAKSSCKKRARKKVDKTCARMRDECLTYYNLQCADSSNPPACMAATATCCGHLEACNFTEHVTCLSQAQ